MDVAANGIKGGQETGFERPQATIATLGGRCPRLRRLNRRRKKLISTNFLKPFRDSNRDPLLPRRFRMFLPFWACSLSRRVATGRARLAP